MITRKHWKVIQIGNHEVLVRAEVEGVDGLLYFEMYLPELGSISQKATINIMETAPEDYDFVDDMMADEDMTDKVRKFVTRVESLVKETDQ